MNIQNPRSTVSSRTMEKLFSKPTTIHLPISAPEHCENSLSTKEKSQPLSGRLALLVRFYCREDCVNPEGGRLTSFACALAKARKSFARLARCCRARTPK